MKCNSCREACTNTHCAFKVGTYSPTNSEVYIKVHKVHHISKRTGKIKMRATVFYKSNNDLMKWITPTGPKNLTLIWDVVKHWEQYEPKH